MMKRIKAYGAIALIVVGGILFGKAMRAWTSGAGGAGGSEVRQKVTARVEEAAQSNKRAAATAEGEMRAVFEQMRTQVPAFVDDINGMGTKCKTLWKGAADLWPYQQDRARVRRMVEEKWNKHMMTPEEVQRRISAILEKFNVALHAERNRMLVEIGSVMGNVRTEGACGGSDVRRAFEERFETTLKGLLAKSLGAEAASLVISEVAGVVVVNIVSHVLVKGGILAAGGLSGPMTFGIGLVVGLIVDWIISNYAEAKMRRSLVAELDKLERQVMDGDGNGALGMAALLHKTAEAVSKAEQEAVRKTFAARW